MVRTLGLPRMHKEAGERRDFLPDFVGFMSRLEPLQEIVVEEGYGSGMGIPIESYLSESPKVRVGTYEECLGQDLVVVLRFPSDESLRKMKKGAVLMSMVHFPTRPNRIAFLNELGLRAVSFDSLTDDLGVRLVENLESVGWNGVRTGMQELSRSHRRFYDPTRRAIRTTIVGAGHVGGHAARAATRYGDPKLREELVRKGVPGVQVTIVDFDLSDRENYMLDLLEHTDLLIDATARRDNHAYVIPNDWIGSMPSYAVLVDLSVDPYDFTVNPPAVKGIEGVPEGNLDQFVFHPDDPVYARMDPRIRTRHRRIALSCYSWPGVEPKGCMQKYGKQLEPLVRVVVEVPLDSLDPEKGRYFERAVARAELRAWSNRS